ncbi:hypothetical protein OMK64_06985 [Cellulomonas fimi]|uniref:hypothetical protein n=1 Tax=Cellulomonas fimi TaxID=1708 RepID=UPI00234D012D|nr:hypothetical protein [Cellulomonas fimi]MDC7121278.1 hypothetical protein [Cellulomonas fimi]
MLVAAALVPDTALLVPGVSGRHDALPGLRDAALAAVAHAVAGAASVVVVAPARQAAEPTGTLRGSLTAVGVPDALLGWPVPEVVVGDAGPAVVPAVASAVALHLLARAGWDGPVRVVEVERDPAAAGSAAALAARGAALVAGAGGPLALVVVGSGSGRHGPDAPLADDERALALDASLTADLARADRAARERIASLDAGLASALAVSGWASWQVLLGAVGTQHVGATLLAEDVSLGAHHVAALWRVTDTPSGAAPTGVPTAVSAAGADSTGAAGVADPSTGTAP